MLRLMAAISWDVVPYNLVEIYRRIGRTNCLHHQDRRESRAWNSAFIQVLITQFHDSSSCPGTDFHSYLKIVRYNLRSLYRLHVVILTNVSYERYRLRHVTNHHAMYHIRSDRGSSGNVNMDFARSLYCFTILYEKKNILRGFLTACNPAFPHLPFECVLSL